MAPHVLSNLVVMAVREVPGIARLGSAPRARPGLRGDGVALRVAADGVSADCYLIAQAGTNLLDVGMAVQATVAAVIRELAGMAVREVNVYIQDVEAGNA
ncbi:MAG TPA: Asp23/Gls24 family envelope stress response protein [Kouleothrix sp.]|uniref:Asp23/Gls24 family envelope stress response protein n=1 Tax=Kouleothrix sp. TaxID=2779161 RepID=UPI002B53C212|nr:Asp23/Gls24 family envelope stress response protein [Kouleothrix sp.]